MLRLSATLVNSREEAGESGHSIAYRLGPDPNVSRRISSSQEQRKLGLAPSTRFFKPIEPT